MAKTAAKANPRTNSAQIDNIPKSSKKIATEAPASLPTSIVSALPAGADIIKHVQAIEKLLPQLQKELAAATKGGAVSLARAFVVFHRLNDRLLSESTAFKGFRELYKQTKELTVPAAFEAAGVPNVTLAEGFRVGISEAWRASIIPEMKKEAYNWLETSGRGSIITAVVNASTLSALAKEMAEKNEELPGEFFKCAQVPNTSVTKTK